MLSSHDSAGHSLGVVHKKSIGSYSVLAGDREVSCTISSRLRKKLIYPIADPNSLRPVVVDVKEIESVDPVAIGDDVRFIDSGDGSGMIVEVLPRRSKLSRVSAGRKKLEQVVVANLDQVIPIMSAAQPDPKWNLLDRYLVSAESLGLESTICITKVDLLEDDSELMEEVAIYRQAGYQVILTSAEDGRGLDELRSALQGRLSVFIGKSGVGKTTLLNALQPDLGLRVNQISRATGKGRHTTTQLAMFSLEFGGQVVDTPGMREFGLWEAALAERGREIDIALYFPEMRPFVGRCKFGLDCSHLDEPKCALRQAVLDGTVSHRRYHSYLRLSEG
jgi:ribosome biogenesis GTPase / thiamine phosphate phosphatase